MPAAVVGQAVSVALRFEKVGLTAIDGQEGDGVFVGVVKDRTYMGGVLRFTVLTDWGGEITADAPASEDARGITEGARVGASWSPSDATVLTE